MPRSPLPQIGSALTTKPDEAGVRQGLLMPALRNEGQGPTALFKPLVRRLPGQENPLSEVNT